MILFICPTLATANSLLYRCFSLSLGMNTAISTPTCEMSGLASLTQPANELRLAVRIAMSAVPRSWEASVGPSPVVKYN